MGLAFGLFLAGAFEYAVIAAWYDAYRRGRVGHVMLITHIQIALWLFVVGSIVAILENPAIPRWFVLVYTEGCAIGAGVMCWRSRRAAGADFG
jgi:hypothetical protein